MLLKEIITICDLLDDPAASGQTIADLLKPFGIPPVEIEHLEGEKGTTDVVRVMVPGTDGKSGGGKSPSLGILGTLGGIGARPAVPGLVSDADGALVAMAAALKLAGMSQRGDRCPGDILLATHICPHAPTQPHEPTPFMGSPVSLPQQIQAEVSPDMDAILSVDTTKGNRVINHQGFAISPTVKDGYILRVSEDLLTIMGWVTGDVPATFPVTMQDITPYGNGVYHINSIMQPSVWVDCPVVGVALTTRMPVPGCATGANMPYGLEAATRFCVEVAKAYGPGQVQFYDPDQFALMQKLYGSMAVLRTGGGK
jgi:uncharacterized protein DUF1177